MSDGSSSDALMPVRKRRKAAGGDGESEGGAGPKRRRSGKRGGGGGGPWRWVRRLLGLAFVLALVGAGTLVGVFLYYGSDPNLPKIEQLADYRPLQTTRVVDRKERVIGTLGSERRTVVTFDRFAKPLVQAIVAAEDPSFWEHQGVDWKGILRAAIENTLQGRWGRRAQGGSTITQQIVKMMLLSPEKSLRRKVQEMILARRISEKLAKEDLLALYLNQANFGHGRYGAEEASRFYFGKSAAELSLGEAAFLAGLPQLPERHSPHRNPESAKNRQRYVLGQMAKHGYIDQAAADQAAAAPITVLDPRAGESDAAPEALARAGVLMRDRVGADQVKLLGTTVKTTIDLDLQRLAREAVERGLEELDERQGYRGPLHRLTGKALDKHRKQLLADRKARGLRDGEIVEGIVDKLEPNPLDAKKGRMLIDLGGRVGVVDLAAEGRYTRGPKPFIERFRQGDVVRVRLAPERNRPDAEEVTQLALELGPQAAMVVLDPQSKEVLALVGGYGFRTGGFDRTIRAVRQPGSAFKPFLYAAAIASKKFTAASIVNDAPDVFEGADAGKDWKPQNYERENYRGPIRLRTALAESVNTVAVKVMAEIGVTQVGALAASCGLVTPIPADVGLTLALGANATTPLELANAYATLAAGGQLADTRLVTAVGDEVLPTQTFVTGLSPDVAFVVTSLLRSVVQEGTAKTAGARLKRPLAGKTGTSSNMRDAWFVGYAPDLLAAVWVGFDDQRSLGKHEAGGRTALPIWTAFMEKALAGRAVHDFTQPPGVTVARIDPSTGLLAAPGADGLDEVFLDGTVPEAPPAAAVGGPGGEVDPDKLLLERAP